MCLENRAHGLRTAHPIFRGPLDPKLEFEPLPKNDPYADRFGARTPTWLVQVGEARTENDFGVIGDAKRVEVGRRARAVEPAVVPRHEAVAVLEVPNLMAPSHPASAEPVAQQDGQPFARRVERELGPVGGGRSMLFHGERLHAWGCTRFRRRSSAVFCDPP